VNETQVVVYYQPMVTGHGRQLYHLRAPSPAIRPQFHPRSQFGGHVKLWQKFIFFVAARLPSAKTDCIETAQVFKSNTPDMQQASQAGSYEHSRARLSMWASATTNGGPMGRDGPPKAVTYLVLALNKCLYLAADPSICLFSVPAQPCVPNMSYRTGRRLQLSLKQRPCQNRQPWLDASP